MNTQHQSKKSTSSINMKAPFELDQDVKTIDLKPVEEMSLKKVFQELIELEGEDSSDDEALQKKYFKEIEMKAKIKKMNSKIYHNTQFLKKENNIKINPSSSNKRNIEIPIRDNSPTPSSEQRTLSECKVSKKGIRKILRKYIPLDVYGKEEIEQMIWEVDEDMDGKMSKYELEKMYKRCIVDELELEPKRMFYLIRFLMFDKERKYYITEEDTLELLRVRQRDDEEFNKAIGEIFESKEEQPDGKIVSVVREKLDFAGFLRKMNSLMLEKRAVLRDKKTNYCEYINKEI